MSLLPDDDDDLPFRRTLELGNVPAVVVFPDKKLRGLSRAQLDEDGTLQGVGKNGEPVDRPGRAASLVEALRTEHSTDAHLVTYIVHEDAAGGAVDLEQFRLNKEALGGLRAPRLAVSHRFVFVDYDLPKDHDPAQRQTLLDDLLAKADSLPWCWFYTTKNGARFVHHLALPVPSGAGFERLVRRILAAYDQAGVVVDKSCADWTRLFRLPRVVRDGVATWEQPWFHEVERAGVVQEVEAEDLVESREPVVEAAERPEVAMTDEEADAHVYGPDGGLTLAAKRVLNRCGTGTQVRRCVFESEVLARPGEGRNAALTAFAGKVCRVVRDAGEGPELAYALLRQASKLVSEERGHDWRELGSRLVTQFWARDEARAEADQRHLPERFRKRDGREDVSHEGQEGRQSPDDEQEDRQPADDEGELSCDDNGKPRACARNVRVGLRLLGASVEYDEFARRERLSAWGDRGRKWRGLGPDYGDACLNALWVAAEDELNLRVGIDKFAIYVKEYAHRRRFHPVRDYLSGLTWDGTPRVDRWLTSYLGVEETDYSRAVGRLLLVAAVRRVRKPGCKFDELVVLEGSQGTGKSTALRVLAVKDDWFSDDLPLGVDGKVVIERTQGRWIIEAGELAGMSKKTVGELKHFLSKEHDDGRRAYGRESERADRSWVCVATTNDQHYLQDTTGNRRFWPVRTTEVHLAELRRDRDQLWAEAATLEAGGVSIRLDPALYEAAAREQAERQEREPWLDQLEPALEPWPNAKVRVEDLWRLLGFQDGTRRTVAENRRLAASMRQLGFGKSEPMKHPAHAKSRQNVQCYRRGDGSQPVVKIRGVFELCQVAAGAREVQP